MKHGADPLPSAVRLAAGEKPFDLAIILGSGMGNLADRAEILATVSYAEIDGWPTSLVSGHAGRLIFGRWLGQRVLFFQGRLHLYQGYDVDQIVRPAHLASRLGCRRLLLTNAAGGIRRDFRCGDFMLVTDHLNLLGANPLQGLTENPFLDLSTLYDHDFYPQLSSFACSRGIALHHGVLAALPGPSYETPAEIRALALLGADAVSMSTIPEAIMAKYLGLSVSALSLIANPAAGLGGAPLSHQEVLEAGRLAEGHLADLVAELIRNWSLPRR